MRSETNGDSLRTTSSFLYHTYPESSGKGSSACQFTLGEVYRQLGGVKNANLSYESFDQDAMNVTAFTKILERATKKARGEEDECCVTKGHSIRG